MATAKGANTYNRQNWEDAVKIVIISQNTNARINLKQYAFIIFYLFRAITYPNCTFTIFLPIFHSLGAGGVRSLFICMWSLVKVGGHCVYPGCDSVTMT